MDVRRITEQHAGDLSAYDAVVVGGPMVLGWHREAAGLVLAQQGALGKMPVAYLMTALILAHTAGAAPGRLEVCLDPRLAKEPKDPGGTPTSRVPSLAGLASRSSPR